MPNDISPIGEFLTEAHFESQVAMVVYNDKGAPPKSAWHTKTEAWLLGWLESGEFSQRTLMRFAYRIDISMGPHLSPTAMRRLGCIVTTKMPHALRNMPNVSSGVLALSRAVHLSRFFRPDALDRITRALVDEGLTTKGSQQ